MFPVLAGRFFTTEPPGKPLERGLVSGKKKCFPVSKCHACLLWGFLMGARRLNQSILKDDYPKELSWIFIGQTDANAETAILWPPDAKNWLTGKDSDAGKDWRQEKKGMTEDEMVGWHHWPNGHEFEQAPGVGDGQGSLACCSPWGGKESDTTEQLNWTELNGCIFISQCGNGFLYLLFKLCFPNRNTLEFGGWWIWRDGCVMNYLQFPPTVKARKALIPASPQAVKLPRDT